MASLPPLAPLPPVEVQKTIPAVEWELYTDAWILLLRSRVESSASEFKAFAPKDESAIVFLTAFYLQLATSGTSGFPNASGATTLRKLCFLLTRRFILETSESPSQLLEWMYLGRMCCCYPSSSAMKKLLAETWARHEEMVTSSLEKAKARMIKDLSSSLDSTSLSSVAFETRLLTILASLLPAAGQVLMAGSDFLDTLAEAYQTHKREDIRKALVANIYVGLTSLLKGSKPNLSLLLDQLFSLKASAGVGTPTSKNQPTILSDVICSSDILARLERYLSANPQKRGQDLLSTLRVYQNVSKPFHHRYQKAKKRITADKGKGRAPDSYHHLPAAGDLHAHRMSLITQIQDLFPDLGSGYIIHLLDFYDESPETIIAHLLEDSLAPELQTLDKFEQLPVSQSSPPYHDPMPPRPTPPQSPTPPATRKNIFDDDVDLAELARTTATNPSSTLRLGRANPTQTADDILADRTQHTANKAAIIAALATFDSDDDERDDTYDVADVGGTVDAADDTDTEAASKRTDNNNNLDLLLLQAYQSNKALFARDSATRRSQPRASLKRETGLTDEAIEGWAVMVARDPKRLAKLENQLALADGGGGAAGISQPELPPTAYRRPGAAEEETGSDTDGPSGSGSPRGGGVGRGGRAGRGRGRGGGGRGRGAGGSAGDQGQGQGTAASRQRKEENKASRANHNRRQQRAKKVARAGGMAG